MEEKSQDASSINRIYVWYYQYLRKQAIKTIWICEIGILFLGLLDYFIKDNNAIDFWTPSIILLVLSGLAWLRYYLTKYRVEKGFFGNNPYEVREVSKFVREHL